HVVGASRHAGHAAVACEPDLEPAGLAYLSTPTHERHHSVSHSVRRGHPESSPIVDAVDGLQGGGTRPKRSTPCAPPSVSWASPRCSQPRSPSAAPRTPAPPTSTATSAR